MDSVITPMPPVPHPTLLSQPFWDGCRNGVLLLQRCDACGRLRFYPAESCPTCGTIGGSWVDTSGRGTLYSWIVVHKNPDRYWRTQIPYISGVVELGDQARLYMPALVTDVGADRVAAGMALQVWFDDVGDGHMLPRWRPT